MDVLMEAGTMLPVLAHAPSTPSSLLELRRKAVNLHMLQFDLELNKPMDEQTFILVINREREHVLATTVTMCVFQGTFELERPQDIYGFPRHPLVLNFQSWCQLLLEASSFEDHDFIMLEKDASLLPQALLQYDIQDSIDWLGEGKDFAIKAYITLIVHNNSDYSLQGIIILFNRIRNSFVQQREYKLLDFTTQEVTYPEPNEDEFQSASLLFPPGTFGSNDE